MPPEQARGDARAIDGRTDVYALGATLYTLLTGRLPYECRPDESTVDFLRRTMETLPVPPRRLNPQISWEVETIILKAMEKEPERRYASAAEMARDLQRVLDGGPIQARRTPLTYRVSRNVAKHRWVAAAVGIGIALGFTIGAVIASFAGRGTA
jgi:serine/threonine-protein kinase